ncbi:MAG: extracellular solute-binding protein [Thaumarchaeota archaeon]|nr:extracellular solute-binding protein [Nitrososphaerota archaeon]
MSAIGLVGLTAPRSLGLRVEGVNNATSQTTSSTTTAGPTSSTQYSTLSDYQDFLNWLQSVSAPYRGKSINVTLEAEFAPYAAQLLNGDFELASGIKANYDIKPYALQLQTVSLMFNTQASSYDVYSLDIENLGLYPSDAVSPYTMAQKYPDITYHGLDLTDYNRFCWDHIATYPPDLGGGNGGNSANNVQVLPFDTPTLVLFYRTDVFEQLGLSLPKNWDDHFANVQAIQKAHLASSPFGNVSMAGPDVSIIYEYLAHLSSFGGALWQIEGNTIVPAMNNDQAIAALENFVRFEPYSDPGSFYFTWTDVFNSISHRSAACGLLWSGFAGWMNDNQRSLVPGLVSQTMNPAGPKGAFHPCAGSGVGVSKYSKNPEMAWLWAQWATAKGTQEAMILGQYHVFPTRSSVTSARVVADEIGTPGMGIANLTNQIWEAGSTTTLIGFPKWLQVSTILANQLNKAWTRAASPADALAGAQTQIEQQVGTITF